MSICLYASGGVEEEQLHVVQDMAEYHGDSWIVVEDCLDILGYKFFQRPLFDEGGIAEVDCRNSS